MTSCYVALLIDQSASLQTSPVSEAAIESASLAIIGELAKIDGRIAINNFATTSPHTLLFNSATDPTAAGNLGNDTGYFILGSQQAEAETFLQDNVMNLPNGASTNWEAAFQSILDMPYKPHTVIFITDGSPTDGAIPPLLDATLRDTHGVRIIGMGIGGIVDNPSSLQQLKDVLSNSSDPNDVPKEGIDYFINNDIAMTPALAAGIIAGGLECISPPPYGNGKKFSISTCGTSDHGKYDHILTGVGGEHFSTLQTIINSISSIISWRIPSLGYTPPDISGSKSILNAFFYDASETLTREFIYNATLDLFLKTDIVAAPGESGEVTLAANVTEVTGIIDDYFNPVSNFLKGFLNSGGAENCEVVDVESRSYNKNNCFSCLNAMYN